MSMKKILAFILSAVCVLSLSSCEKYLDVNNNVDALDKVDGYLYLAGIQQAMGGIYWDIRATSALTQMIYGYGYYQNHYFNSASDAAGETWRYVYWLHGMNLENMINQSIAAENWTLAGIGYAIKAFDWDELVKLNGDAPYFQAYEVGRLSHDYDYQEAIYPEIVSMAEEAIKYLEMEDKTEYGSKLKNADHMYAGDKDKWIKFAHSVIVKNLASLTNKKDFVTKYYPTLVEHAAKGINTNADNCLIATDGGGGDALYSGYNQFWGVYRGNLDSYWQGDYAVQIMTGTVPEYDEFGEKVLDDTERTWFKYKPADNQIICDTLDILGHFDPRVTLKLGTTDAKYYTDMENIEKIMQWRYYGGDDGSSYSQNGSSAQAANIWGTRTASYASSGTYDGEGRWLYHNASSYVVFTAAENKFMLAEAHWKAGKKAEAFEAWKEAVALDVRGDADWMVTGAGPNQTGTDAKTGEPVYSIGGKLPGGDVVTKACYNKMAEAYIAGPYVEGLSIDDFTLSHIMMQKYVALFPWGANEVWVDLRKYHYDIPHTGDIPSMGDGWDNITSINYKKDTDPTKVYKGFYLNPMEVTNKKTKFDYRNEGAPCYRFRPRYNSEYMWNKPSLEKLKPISGTADNFHCSVPWFAYPGDAPRN